MRQLALVAAIGLLVGCGRSAPVAPDGNAGAALEAAATRTGLIVNTADIDIVGAWARDTDRACIVPGEHGRYVFGTLVDNGPGQACAFSGTALRSGDRIDVAAGGCHFTARLKGERLVFPTTVPEACDRFCSGRASLGAVSLDHLSGSRSEAATLRGSRGELLCSS